MQKEASVAKQPVSLVALGATSSNCLLVIESCFLALTPFRTKSSPPKGSVLQFLLAFEDAATIPLAFTVAIYALINIGNLQKGQVS